MHRRSLLAAAVSVMAALSLVLSGCGTKKKKHRRRHRCTTGWQTWKHW